jgi:hypothetical protein
VITHILPGIRDLFGRGYLTEQDLVWCQRELAGAWRGAGVAYVGLRTGGIRWMALMGGRPIQDGGGPPEVVYIFTEEDVALLPGPVRDYVSKKLRPTITFGGPAGSENQR